MIQLEVGNSKALANLVMGLSSEGNARSVVELSLSKCYHYQYSSIAKAIANLHKDNCLTEETGASSWLATEKKFVH